MNGVVSIDGLQIPDTRFDGGALFRDNVSLVRQNGWRQNDRSRYMGIYDNLRDGNEYNAPTQRGKQNSGQGNIRYPRNGKNAADDEVKSQSSQPDQCRRR